MCTNLNHFQVDIIYLIGLLKWSQHYVGLLPDQTYFLPGLNIAHGSLTPNWDKDTLIGKPFPHPPSLCLTISFIPCLCHHFVTCTQLSSTAGASLPLTPNEKPKRLTRFSHVVLFLFWSVWHRGSPARTWRGAEQRRQEEKAFKKNRDSSHYLRAM